MSTRVEGGAEGRRKRGVMGGGVAWTEMVLAIPFDAPVPLTVGRSGGMGGSLPGGTPPDGLRRRIRLGVHQPSGQVLIILGVDVGHPA